MVDACLLLLFDFEYDAESKVKIEEPIGIALFTYLILCI